jgi:hypothetical protein
MVGSYFADFGVLIGDTNTNSMIRFWARRNGMDFRSNVLFYIIWRASSPERKASTYSVTVKGSDDAIAYLVRHIG